ncbi:MAG: 2Fe-2S iron-sulfur cluster-binding protein [Acidobacteriota bacterium]
MPKLTIEDFGTRDVEGGERLVNALASHIDIGHRCGGVAACTTCRVRFLDGEPDRMTIAERNKLRKAELLGDSRLACQITVEDDMHVKVLMRVSEQAWEDAGPEPGEVIEPSPQWVDRPEL